MLKEIYKFIHPRTQNLFLEYKVSFRPRYGFGKPPHPELYKIVDSHRGQYREFLDKALALKENIWSIRQSGTNSSPDEPVWNNGYLPGLDIIALYTMLSHYKPKRYLEIGSGNSTKVAYKAKSGLGLQTKIISIDPHPRAEIDRLADEVIRQPFENTNYDVAGSLEAGDILFIDNSHRILPNSDSMVFFLEVLPRLKKGVIVHIHDIYIPYDYPQFMCDRFYSEQYGLAMYLLAAPEKYRTLLPNYFIYSDKELSERISPIWDHPNLQGVERHGGSYWLEVGS